MPLDPGLLLQLLGSHPARRLSFEELRAGLHRNVAAKLVNISRDGDLELYGYSTLCQFEQKWDLFSLIARGLILDVAQRRVVATPFPKFFNFGEGSAVLPDEPFEVTEKIDGSLGIVFHHNRRWRVSTRGQFNSPQGQWASEYLHRCIDVSRLSPGTTYLAEIVYPENRIVIPYDFSGLVLLAAYDESGQEIPHTSLEVLATEARFGVSRHIRCDSFSDLVSVARGLTHHEEGFVIRFQSGLRIKLKGEAYCRVHKLVCGCTPLALWEAMMMGQDLDSMRLEIPEEMREDFDSIRRLLDDQVNATLAEVRAGFEQIRDKNDKELGLLVQDPASGLTVLQRRFAFACRKQDFLRAVHAPGEWREKLFKTLRPDGNLLKGYVASNAMTRFRDETVG